MRRLNIRNFAMMLFVIGVNMVARDSTVRDWFPHAPELAVIVSVLVILLMVIFQIKTRGWIIIWRGIIYAYRFLIWWTRWTFPNSLMDDLRKQHLIFGREDNPIELSLFEPLEVEDKPNNLAISLRIDNYSQRIVHLEEIVDFYVPDGWAKGYRCGWAFDEIHSAIRARENGDLHISIPASAPSFFHFIIVRAPFLGRKIKSVRVRVIFRDGLQVESGILKIPEHTSGLYRRTST